MSELQGSGERRIQIAPLAGSLGAELCGVDLANLDASDFKVVADALWKYGAIFFRDQDLTRQAHLELAKRFGDPEVHPIANGMEEFPEVIRVHKPAGEAAFFGTSWHTDNSFLEKPSSVTVLYGEQVPPVGGDTVFASMECAYESLSEEMKAAVVNLEAVHSARDAYDPRTTGDAKYKGETAITYTYSDSIYDEVVHPVIRRHALTGRQSIYVNPMFTQKIVGLKPHESAALLAMLYEHSTRLEFTCRFRWRQGSVAIWDNRSVQHYAIDDYRDFDRVMYRVTISGERPSG